MRRRAFLRPAAAVLLLGVAGASVSAPPPTPTPDEARDVLVTPKADYVHVLWNAAARRAELEGPSARALLPALVARLASRVVAPSAPAVVRVDVVFVRENDAYGRPRWDSVRRLARFTGKRAALSAWAASNAAGPAPGDLFETVEWF